MAAKQNVASKLSREAERRRKERLRCIAAAKETRGMMAKPRHEPYNDDELYQFTSEKQGLHIEHGDFWISPTPSDLPPLWNIKTYSYLVYVRNYQADQRERVLSPKQSTPLSELEFLKSKKRLQDLLTSFKNPPERVKRQCQQLMCLLGLDPYQRCDYQEYKKRYEDAVKKGCPELPSQQLTKDEFMLLKKQLLENVRAQRNGQVNKRVIQEEAHLEVLLFPPELYEY